MSPVLHTRIRWGYDMTIVGKDGIFPQSINRRITEILAMRSAFGFTTFGDTSSIVANTITNVTDSNGIYNRLQTGAVTNEYAGVYGGLLYNRQKEPSYYCRFKLGSSSNTRMFIGLTDQTIDVPVFTSVSNGHYAGLYVNPSVSSTFRSGRAGGSTFTTASLGTSVDTNYHDLYIWLKKSGGANSMILQLDGGTRVEYTTSIPSTSAVLRSVAAIGNVTNTSKNIEIAKISINSEV